MVLAHCKVTNKHSIYVNLLLFHCNNGSTNVPQYYVTRKLPILLNVMYQITYFNATCVWLGKNHRGKVWNFQIK